jgi:hypothetical protein
MPRIASLADVRARELAEHRVHGAVVDGDRPLVGLVILHERRAGRPLVGKQTTKQPRASLTGRAGADGLQSTEPAVIERQRALGGIRVPGVNDVRVGRLQERVGDIRARAEKQRRESRRHSGGRAHAPGNGIV